MGWSPTKASRVLSALLDAGWSVKRVVSHSPRVITLSRHPDPDVVWPYQDGETLGPTALEGIEEDTGITPADLK
jgi:predicted RNA binding protein YcfA (HicA-like mRNA interferase family)